jgi:predicted glycogen debranching enzyme
MVFGHSGMFMGSPDWWRRFEYTADQRRNVHYQEDLWTPGTFELALRPGEPTYLVVGLGEIPETEPSELMAQTENFLRALDPGKEHSLAVRALHIAAEQYRVADCERPATIAGYPWLGVRTRDTLISLVGLYLVPGLVEQAKHVLATVTSAHRGGLLLSGMKESSTPNESPSVDASLWLFETVRELVKITGPSDDFVQQRMLPLLIGIFDRVTRPTPAMVWLTDDGLLETGGDAEALTWMDSFARGQLVTPRRGLAVELQALWSRGCDTLAMLADESGNSQLAHRARAARDATRSAFKKCFWCEETNYPYDHLDATADPLATSAIRPNALIALSVDPEMFERWQAQAIVLQARTRLLTPKGLRTLDPGHPQYVGYYEGGMEDLRAAYHQGVVWGYLLGVFARAALRLEPDDFELQMDLRDSILAAMNHGPTLGQVSQLASGDPPFVTGGSPAQAWSVAEFLRTLQRELGR